MSSTPLRRSVSTRKSNLTDTINHDRKRGGSFIEQASHNLKRRVGSVLSILFLVPKKAVNQRQVINLKQLISSHHINIKWTVCTASRKFHQKGAICTYAGFKGCLLLCLLRRKNLEICEISLVRQPVWIHISLLWRRASTADIHKIAENSSGFLKHASNYTTGQYVSVWKDHGGSTNELSKCDIYSPVC